MDPSSPTRHLEAFKRLGRREDLLAYVGARGGNPDPYAAAIDALRAALEPLAFGLRPALGALDRESLREHAAATTEILDWLADSPNADLKTAAMEVMGSLGWEAFVPRLERALSAAPSWERVAAIDGLAKLPGRRAAELVRRAVDDPDPAVRSAARQIVESRGANGEEDLPSRRRRPE